MQLGTHRSKGLLQNFCQNTEHCLVAFDDIPSYERIEVAQVAWLLEGTLPSLEFSVWAMIDVVCTDKFTIYLELL